jgi:8-oxo-dGTP pyrophosphatase MutT (NUDIX family)
MYARLDPACITVLECNGHLLLGSNLRWARGRFSALAGFVEVGESLEQAASREVFEEAGIVVRSSLLPGETLLHMFWNVRIALHRIMGLLCILLAQYVLALCGGCAG